MTVRTLSLLTCAVSPIFLTRFLFHTHTRSLFLSLIWQTQNSTFVYNQTTSYLSYNGVDGGYYIYDVAKYLLGYVLGPSSW